MCSSSNRTAQTDTAGRGTRTLHTPAAPCADTPSPCAHSTTPSASNLHPRHAQTPQSATEKRPHPLHRAPLSSVSADSTLAHLHQTTEPSAHPYPPTVTAATTPTASAEKCNCSPACSARSADALSHRSAPVHPQSTARAKTLATPKNAAPPAPSTHSATRSCSRSRQSRESAASLCFSHIRATTAHSPLPFQPHPPAASAATAQSHTMHRSAHRVPDSQTPHSPPSAPVARSSTTSASPVIAASCPPCPAHPTGSSPSTEPPPPAAAPPDSTTHGELFPSTSLYTTRAHRIASHPHHIHSVRKKKVRSRSPRPAALHAFRKPLEPIICNPVLLLRQIHPGTPAAHTPPVQSASTLSSPGHCV